MHLALSYYVEATRDLHMRISNGRGGEEVETTLLCSLLLSGFELLRGYHKAAQIHLQGIASLLQAWNERQKSGRGGSLWSPRGYFIRERLRPLFQRMALQVLLYSNIASSSSPSSSSRFGCDGGILAASIADNHDNKNKRIVLDEPTVRVSSPTEERDTLYRLICQLYLLPEGRRSFPENVTTQASPSRGKRRDSFIGSLHQWHRALTDYLEQQATNDASSTMLRLFDAAARVIIPTCTLDSDDQKSFDAFSDQFHEMTDLAEKLLFLLSPPPPLVPSRNLIPPLIPGSDVDSCFFSLDMGVLHLLYYVAVRCRVTLTRGWAVALLQRAQARREGVWDGAATALVASRVVAMEEERSKNQGVGEMDAVGGDGSINIPASARVRSIWTETDLEKRTVLLRCGWQQGLEYSEELLTW